MKPKKTEHITRPSLPSRLKHKEGLKTYKDATQRNQHKLLDSADHRRIRKATKSKGP